MKMIIRLIALSCLALLLSACGFQLHNPDAMPEQLHTVFLQSNQPSSELTTRLKEMLRSQKIHIVTSPSQARYGLVVSDKVVTTTRSTSVVSTLHASIHLVDHQERGVLPAQSFSATQSVILNNNQVMTTFVDDSVTHELANDIVNRIYYWLTSAEVHDALSNTARQKHAIKTATTR